jgi:DNA-binding NtrC family response regulator
MEAVTRHEWRGNVRELRNAVERAMILSAGRSLQIDLPKIASPDAEHRAIERSGFAGLRIVSARGREPR